MGDINKGKEWTKDEIIEIFNTPEEKYKELAKKFGRSFGAINSKHRTKQEINKVDKITKFVRKTKPDKWMWALFAEGKSPKM